MEFFRLREGRVSGWVRDRNDRDRKLFWLISPTYVTYKQPTFIGVK